MSSSIILPHRPDCNRKASLTAGSCGTSFARPPGQTTCPTIAPRSESGDFPVKLDLDNSRPSRARQPWGPIRRTVEGLGGVALLALGTTQRGWTRIGLRAVGVGLVVRAAAGVPLRRLISSGRDPYAFEARRSIVVARPVGEVFALLSDYGNYPDFMPNVRDMEILPGLRHRWTMVAPGGVGIPVRDVITQLVPDEFVAWESEPESTLPYAGAARFHPVAGGTRVEARMSYGPPLGALGNALATLIRQGPAQQLAEILTRAKGYLEAGGGN